jgi:hypothetical protein
MGVEGLTTYLREHRLAVAKTIEVYSTRPNAKKRIDIVVDGWSFIYMLYQGSHIPWVYGGEYDQFAAAIRHTVGTWIKFVNLSFVFDGTLF